MHTNCRLNAYKLRSPPTPIPNQGVRLVQDTLSQSFSKTILLVTGIRIEWRLLGIFTHGNAFLAEVYFRGR